MENKDNIASELVQSQMDDIYLRPSETNNQESADPQRHHGGSDNAQ